MVVPVVSWHRRTIVAVTCYCMTCGYLPLFWASHHGIDHLVYCPTCAFVCAWLRAYICAGVLWGMDVCAPSNPMHTICHVVVIYQAYEQQYLQQAMSYPPGPIYGHAQPAYGHAQALVASPHHVLAPSPYHHQQPTVIAAPTVHHPHLHPHLHTHQHPHQHSHQRPQAAPVNPSVYGQQPGMHMAGHDHTQRHSMHHAQPPSQQLETQWKADGQMPAKTPQGVVTHTQVQGNPIQTAEPKGSNGKKGSSFDEASETCYKRSLKWIQEAETSIPGWNKTLAKQMSHITSYEIVRQLKLQCQACARACVCRHVRGRGVWWLFQELHGARTALPTMLYCRRNELSRLFAV